MESALLASKERDRRGGDDEITIIAYHRNLLSLVVQDEVAACIHFEGSIPTVVGIGISSVVHGFFLQDVALSESGSDEHRIH